ncbi:hypothetical protein X975_02693, partial [Stegodyphus mimosarum]
MLGRTLKLELTPLKKSRLDMVSLFSVSSRVTLTSSFSNVTCHMTVTKFLETFYLLFYFLSIFSSKSESSFPPDSFIKKDLFPRR